MRGEIHLVDDEQVGADDAGAALARDVAAAGDVDDEDPPVDEVERKGRGEVVTARLEDDEIETGEARLQFVAGEDVERRVLADHRVRAGAGLDGGDARGVDEAGAAQALGILLCDEIVGDDGEIDALL